MSATKFAKIVPVKEIVDHELTLQGFRFVEGTFGTSVYVRATDITDNRDVIFTTGSVALVELFKAFDESDDVAGLQIMVKERGKSYQIEDLSND